MFFIYCLLLSFSDAAYSEHSYLVEIEVERSIFECNIQNSKKCSKIIWGDYHTWLVGPLVIQG